MEQYSRIDLIFPKTNWVLGAGDLYLILLAIVSYLEKWECTEPEYEYLNTCDLYDTERPSAYDWETFTKVYLNVTQALAGRPVINVRLVNMENCTVMELICNRKDNTSCYH